MEGGAVPRVRVAVIVLAVFFVLYVGAYFALLDTTDRPRSRLGPIFKIEGETTHAVFAPLAWLDYQIRPGYWKSRAHLSPF
jgi:hypothetical protein